MPHSLKSKVKSLCYKGEITEKERDRLLKALDEQEWIPVSKEPTKGIYLVTRQYKQHRYVEMATYDGDNPQDVFSWEGYSDEWKLHRAEHKVLAWKPAPEPYGGDTDETN